MRHIEMTVSRGGIRLFQGVVDCVDLGDLNEAVSEGVLAFQRANRPLSKQARLEDLTIDLREVGGAGG